MSTRKRTTKKARKKPVRKAAARRASKPAAIDSEAVANRMATKHREISVSEFFTKNRHLLGFDNPRKALLTTVKEAVDNSLDACEEAGIAPDISITIQPVKDAEDRFTVTVQDNGPGIVARQLPHVFGRLLYGSKFHRLRQSRGQQGIGISAAAMYGQLTTGKPVRIWSRISRRKPAEHVALRIDTQKNRPEILRRREVKDFDGPHGTRIEITLEARYQKGRQSVDQYLLQTAIANPHLSLRYTPPDAPKNADDAVTLFERATRKLPAEAREIRPHPYGVELGMLLELMKADPDRQLSPFLQATFSRVSARVAKQIADLAGVDPKTKVRRIASRDLDQVHIALGKVKVMAPRTDCLSPIGENLILKGLQKEVDADFYATRTRPPTVYRGNPFQVEVGIAYGGELPADDSVRLMRFANRVPLQYQQSACAVFKAATSTDWRNYHLSQPRGALPVGPMVVFIHLASVWVPFTSESKEAIAHYPEIIQEIKRALQECGRLMANHVSKQKRMAQEAKKRSYIDGFLPHIGDALRDILKLKVTERDKTVATLEKILEKTRKF